MTLRLTASILLLCRLCALVASSSPSPSPSPSTTTTVTTTDGGGWPWWAWFLVTVLPCCILLLCCGAGGAIPLFLRKKKPVAAPAHVYQTPYGATTASAPGNGGRSDGDCDQAHDDDANDDWRARGDHESDACDDVHGSIRGACCASRVLRWGATVWCQTANGAFDVPLKPALFIEEIRSNPKRRDPHPPTFYIMTNLNPKEVAKVKQMT